MDRNDLDSPYWLDLRNWQADHNSLLLRLDSARFSLPSLEKRFLESERSLQKLQKWMDPGEREELQNFQQRYGDLRAVRMPASSNSIFALKPTYQRIPAVQTWRAAPGRSHNGPMTRTIRDSYQKGQHRFDHL